MTRIQVSELIQKDIAVNSQQDSIVKDLIERSMKKNEDILLDFTGIRAITNAFLGELFKGISEEKFASRIQIDPDTLPSSSYQRIVRYKEVVSNPALNFIEWDENWNDIEE